mmetsp:Transcript_14278/g.12593  ORF Transcript_14278/g.12593 Transcript_14278/m.12593 type:complete len:86 (+) Transcript_14278:3-260(+)
MRSRTVEKKHNISRLNKFVEKKKLNQENNQILKSLMNHNKVMERIDPVSHFKRRISNIIEENKSLQPQADLFNYQKTPKTEIKIE